MKKSQDELKWMLQHCKRKSAMFGKIAPRTRAIGYAMATCQHDMFAPLPDGVRADRSLDQTLTSSGKAAEVKTNWDAEYERASAGAIEWQHKIDELKERQNA